MLRRSLLAWACLGGRVAKAKSGHGPLDGTMRALDEPAWGSSGRQFTVKAAVRWTGTPLGSEIEKST